jgi:hypothetical protein
LKKGDRPAVALFSASFKEATLLGKANARAKQRRNTGVLPHSTSLRVRMTTLKGMA